MSKENYLIASPELHLPVHLVSDVDYWRDWFRKLSEINEQHSRVLAEFTDSTQQYSQRLNLHESIQTDEMGFYADLVCVQSNARTRSEKLRQDSWQYKKLAETIEKYKPGVANAGHIDLECLDRHYTDAKKKLDANAKAVDRQMKAYHKASFERDDQLIRAKLATSEETLKNAENKIRRQMEKADDMLFKYKRQLSRWQENFEEIKGRSERFEEAYLKQQEGRADLVLSCLRESVMDTHFAVNIHRDFMFDGINGRNIIEKKVIQKEPVPPPEFKEFPYAPDINVQYETAKSALDRMDTELANVQLTAFQVNELLKHIRKSHQFEVVTSHRKQNVGELELRVGDRLIQILPPNEAGIAYGELSSGAFRRSKRGFYSASCVKAVIDVKGEDRLLQAIDDFEKGSKNTQKQTTKEQEPLDFCSIDYQFDDHPTVASSKKKSLKRFFSKERFMRSIYGVEIEAADTIVSHRTQNDVATKLNAPDEVTSSSNEAVLSDEADGIGGQFIVNRIAYDHDCYGDYIIDSDDNDDVMFHDNVDENILLEDIEGCWAGGGDQ